MLHFSLNENQTTVTVKRNENVVDTMSMEEFQKMYQQAGNILESLELKEALDKREYAQIIMEDIEDTITEIENVKGIQLEIRWMTRLQEIESDCEILLRNGRKEDLHMIEYIGNNFEYRYSRHEESKISSRIIRRCFESALLNYIAKTPDFEVWINGHLMPHEQLVSDEHEGLYGFVYSSDT